ncbi:MAG: aspartate dehydrogenase [Eubacteriales bacterium]|nr:aspartate dehydrogenase [Eubacteriales bacterium]
MFGRRKKEQVLAYDKERQQPAVRASICTGERVAGFVDRDSGKFEEVTLIRNNGELAQFCAKYGITESDLKKIW